jgi:hypothetical protein
MCGIACFAEKTSDMRLTSMIFYHLSVGVPMPTVHGDLEGRDEQVDPPEAATDAVAEAQAFAPGWASPVS